MPSSHTNLLTDIRSHRSHRSIRFKGHTENTETTEIFNDGFIDVESSMFYSSHRENKGFNLLEEY